MLIYFLWFLFLWFVCTGDHPETDEESELNARNRLHHHHCHHRRASTSKPASEDEFAEDELSVGEPSEARMLTSNGPAWGTCPAGNRQPRERRGRSPRSLDRRKRDKSHDVGEFHEGMLLDALLQLYPSVAGTFNFRYHGDYSSDTLDQKRFKLSLELLITYNVIHDIGVNVLLFFIF